MRALLPLLPAGRLIEEPSNLELLVREDVALQQLVLASMGTNPLVVQQAVKIMSAVGAYAGAAKRLVKHNVVRAVTGMLASGDKVSQGCAPPYRQMTPSSAVGGWAHHVVIMMRLGDAGFTLVGCLLLAGGVPWSSWGQEAALREGNHHQI